MQNYDDNPVAFRLTDGIPLVGFLNYEQRNREETHTSGTPYGIFERARKNNRLYKLALLNILYLTVPLALSLSPASKNKSSPRSPHSLIHLLESHVR